MSLLTWVVFGLITGLVINYVSPNSRSFLGTILLGVLGAVLGGFLESAFSENNGSLISMIGVFSGAILLLFMQRALLRNS